MSEAEELTTKKKVRVAQLGYITKIVSKVYDNLESSDGPSLSRLRQQKLLLYGKLEVLTKLDDELIELVD